MLAVQLFELWNAEHSMHQWKNTALVLVHQQCPVQDLFDEFFKAYRLDFVSLKLEQGKVPFTQPLLS